MKTQNQYESLYLELEAIERTNGDLYLIDFNVDAENCTHLEPNSDEWWNQMYLNLAMNAGMRAEALGLNINQLVGRIIY
jgi:hypothetical protein